MSFEEDYVKKIDKQVYAFDCGNGKWPSDNPKIKFIKECVGTDMVKTSVWSYGRDEKNDQITNEVFDSYNSQIKN